MFGRAFTLVEMLVSLAVLVVALSVIGAVFAITTKTVSQAAAYSEVQNWVRQFTEQVKEDLKFCEPSNSILVLVGRTQPAALTQDDLSAGKFYRVLTGDPSAVAAGYDPEFSPSLDNADEKLAQYSNPRADIMMFFSNRPTVSQAPPADPCSPYAAGAKLAPIQVVYGHAALAVPVLSGTTHQFPPDTALRHIGQTVAVGGNVLSGVPANQWHLARRAVIVSDPNVGAAKVVFTPVPGFPWPPGVGNEWERITRCMADNTLNPRQPGDAAALNLPSLLAALGPIPAAPNSGPALFFPYDLDINNDPFTATLGGMTWRRYEPYPGLPNLVRIIRGLLYPQGSEQNHHVATVLTNVPVELRSNLGVHMLPGCAWFQVEFLMPEDPRNSVEYAMADPLKSQSDDMPRWTAVEPGKTYVFVPDTVENRQLIARQIGATGAPLSPSRLESFARLDQVPANDTIPAMFGTATDSTRGGRIIRLWPYAIRITVRVYDGRGRLEQPVVRSIVHRFD